MKNVKKIFAFLLCIFTLLSLFSSCNFEKSTSDVLENSDVSAEESSIREPRIISHGMSGASGCVDLSHKIAARTSSYYENGDKIVVELFMGDEYSNHQKHGQIPSYDTYGTNGYPMFQAYESVDVVQSTTVNENSLLTFNGVSPLYEKKFNAEDMEGLDITNRWETSEPATEWHRETVEVDFSKLNPGDFGRIVFQFGWFYDDDSPFRSPNDSEAGKNYYMGKSETLEYYVGENGIALSFLGWETAREEAAMIEGKTFPAEE